MFVVFEVRTDWGTQRRCDERCVNGTRLACSCVCQGINHGVGYNQALENTRECYEWLVELVHERRCGTSGEVDPPGIQPLLWG